MGERYTKPDLENVKSTREQFIRVRPSQRLNGAFWWKTRESSKPLNLFNKG